MSDTARAFIDEARELPVMPTVATEVLRRAEDPDSDVNGLAELISRDAGLATRILRIANSSLYAGRREIETIQQAVVLLGLSTLRSIVIAASLKDVFANYGMTERLLWDHAVAGGMAANAVALEVSGFAPDEVFIAGLLHDIGKLAMHAQDGTRYARVTSAVNARARDAASAEREIFGFDHARIGELLLRKWELPERLALAVAAHHDPGSAPDEAKPLAALLQVADLLCLQQGLGRPQPDPELKPLECAGAQLLGASDIEPERVILRFKEMLEKERRVFVIEQLAIERVDRVVPRCSAGIAEGAAIVPFPPIDEGENPDPANQTDERTPTPAHRGPGGSERTPAREEPDEERRIDVIVAGRLLPTRQILPGDSEPRTLH